MSTGAVVTGAGRGVGRLLARMLVERGHTVLVTDLDEGAAAAVATELRGLDGAEGRVTHRAVDVREAVQVEAARDEILARSSRLEVWINNAGILLTGPAWEQTAEQRQLMLDVNTAGVINGTVAAIESMRDRPGERGQIVNIASLAALTPVPGEAVYAASKHAVVGFSLSTLADLRRAGIENVDISCVCPDGIWTPMLHDRLQDPEAALSFSGKLLEPGEVVDAVARVLERPRPVLAVPSWRGVQARFAATVPTLGLRALPLMAAIGRRNQRRVLTSGKGA